MNSITINGARIHYRWDGDIGNPTVMLSNSLASNLHMWDPQIDALLAGGYRVLRYDSRGMGESEVTQGPYSIAQLSEDAVALMDALDLTQVHFCGLSKGGMVGQTLGTQHAGRLLSLSLCDTAAYAGPSDVWQGRIDAARAGGMQGVVDGTLERWFTPAGHSRIPAAIATVREMILSTPPDGFVACCEAIAAMDQRESIRAINTPTLVVVGADDPGTPVSAAELIAERIAGSKLVVLPDAAHLSNIEQPEAFNSALLDFLDQHR